MQRYSIFSLLRNACSHHRGWQRAWRSPELRKHYDVIIVGAGGHGLATAYYLARDHGVTNVAVLERGWLGGGNTGRNTVTIRSNYLRDPSIKFFEASVKLYEQFTRELNINIMFSQRSQIDVVQTWGKLRDLKRRSYAMDLHGPDYTVISPQELRRRIPVMADLSNARLARAGGRGAQTRGGGAPRRHRLGLCAPGGRRRDTHPPKHRGDRYSARRGRLGRRCRDDTRHGVGKEGRHRRRR